MQNKKKLILLTLKEKTELIAKCKGYFAGRAEVLSAYIFGSFAQNKLTPLSDIDIAVYIDKNKINEKEYPYGYASHLLSRLMLLLARNNVDLVILNHANLLLCHRVIARGIRIFSREIKQAQRREYYYIQQYLDFKPMLQKFQRKAG
jgi:predicted nucleotidyltransferase